MTQTSGWGQQRNCSPSAGKDSLQSFQSKTVWLISGAVAGHVKLVPAGMNARTE